MPISSILSRRSTVALSTPLVGLVLAGLLVGAGAAPPTVNQTGESAVDGATAAGRDGVLRTVDGTPVSELSIEEAEKFYVDASFARQAAADKPEHHGEGAAATAVALEPAVLSASLLNAENRIVLPSKTEQTFTGTVTGAPSDTVIIRLQSKGAGSWANTTVFQTVVLDESGVGHVAVTFTQAKNTDGTFRFVSEQTARTARAEGGEKKVSVAAVTLVATPTTVERDVWKLDATTGFRITANLTTAPVAYSTTLARFDKKTATWVVVKTVTAARGTVTLTAPRVPGDTSPKYRLATIPPNTDYVGTTSAEFVAANTQRTTIITSPELAGATRSYPANLVVKITGTIKPAAVRGVKLQRFDTATNTWVTEDTVPTSEAGAFQLKMPSNEKPSEKWRAIVEQTKSFTEASIGTTVLRPLQNATVVLLTTKTRIPMWETYAPSWYVGIPKRSTVHLQRLILNRWTTIEAKRTDDNYRVSFNTPKGSTATKAFTENYRLVISKHAYGYQGSVTPAYKFVRENPNHYTGMAKTAYKYFRGYCPTTLVSAQNLPGTLWGLAKFYEGYVIVDTAVPAKHLRTVALHECAHMRQWSMYGGGNWQKFLHQNAVLYKGAGTLGMERNADCIANAWYKNSYFSYKGSCTGAMGSAGAALAKGQKYFK